MKSPSAFWTTWLLLGSFVVQSLLWVLPSQRAEASDRLAHELVHALDHGQHQHDSHGHELDASLLLAEDSRQPWHSHAAESLQLQGLPVSDGTVWLALPRGEPAIGVPLPPPWTHLDGLLRPPRVTA